MRNATFPHDSEELTAEVRSKKAWELVLYVVEGKRRPEDSDEKQELEQIQERYKLAVAALMRSATSGDTNESLYNLRELTRYASNRSRAMRWARAAVTAAVRSHPHRFGALHIAATNGHLNVMTLLLSLSADAEQRGINGRTALHVAVECGRSESVAILINQVPDLDVDAADLEGFTALHIAAQLGDETTIKILLSAKCHPNHPNAEGLEPAVLALRRGHVRSAAAIIRHCLVVEGESAGGWNRLMLAALCGAEDTCQALIATKGGSDGFNAGAQWWRSLEQRADGLTALHCACVGSEEARLAWPSAFPVQSDPKRPPSERGPLFSACATLLVRHGWSPLIAMTSAALCKQTPWHWAARAGLEQTLASLALHPAISPFSVIATDSNAQNALHIAAGSGRLACLSFMLDYLGSVDGAIAVSARDQLGRTPLHCACDVDHPQAIPCIQLLIPYCDVATLNSGDHLGRTALHALALHGRDSLVKELITAGAATDIVTTRGRTPLHWAAAAGQAAVVEVLVAAGASPVQLDSWRGEAPLHFAAANGHVQVVRALCQSKQVRVGVRGSWDGATPLHWAAGAGHALVVALLLEKGAKAWAQDLMGRTPLHDACRGARLSCVEMLWHAMPSYSAMLVEDVKGFSPYSEVLVARREHLPQADALYHLIINEMTQHQIPIPSVTSRSPSPTAKGGSSHSPAAPLPRPKTTKMAVRYFTAGASTPTKLQASLLQLQEMHRSSEAAANSGSSGSECESDVPSDGDDVLSVYSVEEEDVRESQTRQDVPDGPSWKREDYFRDHIPHTPAARTGVSAQALHAQLVEEYRNAATAEKKAMEEREEVVHGAWDDIWERVWSEIDCEQPPEAEVLSLSEADWPSQSEMANDEVEVEVEVEADADADAEDRSDSAILPVADGGGGGEDVTPRSMVDATDTNEGGTDTAPELAVPLSLAEARQRMDLMVRQSRLRQVTMNASPSIADRLRAAELGLSSPTKVGVPDETGMTVSRQREREMEAEMIEKERNDMQRVSSHEHAEKTGKKSPERPRILVPKSQVPLGKAASKRAIERSVMAWEEEQERLGLMSPTFANIPVTLSEKF